MSESRDGAPGIPAGWYPDPADPSGLRWWDGEKWTGSVQKPLPPAQVDPMPQTLPRPTAAPAQQLPETGYVPFQRAAELAAAAPSGGLAHTRAMWWICAQPIWGVVTQVMLFALVSTFGTLPITVLVPGYLVLNLALIVVLVALAFSDRAALLRGGNRSAAAPWWILLSPLVYLILRAREASRWEEGGWAGVLWWCIAAVLSPVLAILGYFAVLGAVPV